MKSLHNIMIRGLVSALSLTVLFGATGVEAHRHISASSYRLIKIITNKDKLWLQDPNKRGYHTMGYADHNKGMHVRMVGSFYRHHRLYYEVVPNGYGAQFPAFILASSTNAVPRTHSHYRVRKARYKFGYWKRGRYHAYKTGYFLNGKWHRKITFSKSKSRRIRKRNKRSAKSYHHYKNNKKVRHVKKSAKHLKRQNRKPNYNSLINAARNANFKTINDDRASVGVDSVSRSSLLDKMAQLRSKQLVKNDSHYDSNGNLMITKDLSNVGYDPSIYNGENIAFNAGYRLNGKSAGKFANTEWWTNEKGATPDQDGGHRKNIRDPNFESVGIGATYLPKKDAWYMCQDFSDQSPSQIDGNSNDSNDDNSSNNNDDSYTVNNNNNNGSSSTSYSNGFSNNNNNNSNGGSAVAVAGGGVGGSATGGTVYSSNGTIIARGGSAAGGVAGGAAVAA